MSNRSAQQRRIVAAIVLATLGVTGVLVAQGATQLTAAALLPLDPSASAPASLASVRPNAPTDVNALPILRRNIFDRTTGRMDVAPVTEPIAGPTVGEETEPTTEYDGTVVPPPCDGSMRLVGAFVRVRDPEDSFAAITSATGESLLYQRGMQIDEREVVAIERNLVVLLPRGGRHCSLSMFAEAASRIATVTPPVSPVAATGPAETSSPEGLDSAELEAGITQNSESSFTIERALVDRLLSNQAALMRTARVIPHEEGGRTVGVKLYGIRRSSLLGRLGIQNGDMLRTINGYDMAAPDSALEAYARLRSADRITINLNRRGQDQAIDYQIR